MKRKAPLLAGIADTQAGDVSDQLTLTPAQMEELDRRLADYEKNPDEGVEWEEVRDRVRTSRYRSNEALEAP